MIKSCHICATVFPVIEVKQSFHLSNTQVHWLSKFSHVPHVSVNESCLTYEWVFPFEKRKRSIHVKNLKESCSTYKRIIPHIQKCLYTREMERRIHVKQWRSQIPHMNESSLTYKWVFQIEQFKVTFTSHTWMKRSCSTHKTNRVPRTNRSSTSQKRIMSYIQTSLSTRTMQKSPSRPTHEWIMSHIWTSQSQNTINTPNSQPLFRMHTHLQYRPMT